LKIGDILVRDSIILDLKGRDKEQVLAEMAKALADSTPGVDEKRLFEAVKERETLQSTGIGEGAAVPHVKLPDLPGPVTCFARSREGVDFGSLDGRPAHLFFLLVVPEYSDGHHLKVLARISRFLHDPGFRELLWDAETREDVCLAIEEEDAKL
jgi:PTS system nitrogen regulatory IIA component